MGGDADMMSVLATKYTGARKITSYTFTYDTKIGIAQSADNMHAGMGTDKPNSIMIAQCMGGVNALYLKHFDANTFGGMITMGSPFAGTYVSQNIQNGVYARFVQDALLLGTQGTRAEVANLLSLSVAGIPGLEEWANRKIEDLISELIIKKTTDPLVPFGTPSVIQEFVPGSPILNQIKTYNESYPKIAIWGNENGNALVHLAGSKFDNWLQKTLFGHYAAEGKLSDGTISEVIDRLTSFCDDRSVTWDEAAVFFGNPVAYKKCKSLSAAWHQTSVYWNNTFNASCAALIGATRYEWRTEGYWSLGCPGGSSGLEKQIAPRPCEPQDMVEVWKFRTITVSVTTPSDGLITQNSAVAMPGVQQNCILKADGVNHEELKNHDEMFRIFNNIFSGNSGYRDDRFPDFFKVPTK